MIGPTSRLVSDAAQSFSFTRRAMMVSALQIGVGTLLAGRLTWLAVAENERYSLLAESNRVNLTLVPPRRGWIVDRKGAPIANNRTDFRIDIIPDRLESKDRVLAELRTILNLTPEELLRIETDLKRAAGFQPVQIAENLDWERFAAVSVRLPELPGVAPTRGFSRFYPAGAAVGHLTGYVGAATAEQYKETRDPLFVTPGFKFGKDGLEKTLEPRLRGKPGAKRIEVTARGKLVRELATRADTPGAVTRLTIDAGLQEYAARRLGPGSGSAVAIDCQTGGILALASMPSFDPNSFSDGISHNEWTMLSRDERIPLMNKSLQGLYPPGSTFKPATALALLSAGVDPERVVYCNGGYQLGNRRFGCLGRHGPMTLRTAIARSCNTYFYSMGREIGIAPIAAAARALGFGAEHDLPLPSQRYGTVPDAEWKQRKYDQAWTAADTLNTSIGQGYLLVSPLQLAIAAARVASGRSLAPSLLLGSAAPTEPLAFPAEHLAMVRQGMDDVVNGAGTAGRSKLQVPGIRLAGKTGTAQVRRLSGMARGGLNVPWKYRDHGLFIGFAPVEDPRYAVAVVIEHGMSGSGAAAPVASDMITYMFDRERAVAKLAAFEAEWGGDIRTRMATQASAFAAAQAAPPAPPPADAEAATEAVVDAAAGAVANTAPVAGDEAPAPPP